jgi:predicted nuclease of predicted toxin-antitoxin system
MKVLLDMNLSPEWVGFLANAGIDAVHWSAIGLPNATDVEIMSVAGTHGFVVISHDLDFSAILASTRGEKPSVVQIRGEDLRIQTIGSAVVGALRQMAPELEAGALLSVDLNRTRMRLLPLRGADN